ncbi:MAG: hypothetical protein IPG67_10345 [Acidobacteria bacterium]|nr:hypothetical protein [Acidobacteriota bacterium]MBK7932575.1 hypothetical protein [Acidobacteriota bacterium]
MVDPIQLSTPQAIVYAAIINAGIGFVLGLIPLLLGYFYKQLRTGIIGILVATIGGGVIGIFASIPAAIIFTWLIVRNSKPGMAVESEAVEDPADSSTDND